MVTKGVACGPRVKSVAGLIQQQQWQSKTDTTENQWYVGFEKTCRRCKFREVREPRISSAYAGEFTKRLSTIQIAQKLITWRIPDNPP